MDCLKMITVKHGGNVHKVACGKCAYCLQNKRSQWMFRIHHEMRKQQYRGWFITFTYDEKHVPRRPVEINGKIARWVLSLRFRDIQLFLKKVRKQNFYCKYICVGEYGGVTQRPHYHMLLWTDCPPEKLEKIWSYGTCHFGTLTMQSAMYTLKYIIQPKVRWDDADLRERTRAQFSKGLGLGYLTTSVYEFHTEDYENPIFYSYIDGNKVALPAYYKRKIFTKYQTNKEASRIKWQKIREQRRMLRDLTAQGLADHIPLGQKWKFLLNYLQTIRVENANRIINTTKYNTKL